MNKMNSMKHTMVTPVGNMQGSPSLRMTADMNINAGGGTSATYPMVLNQALSSNRTTASPSTPSMNNMAQRQKPGMGSLKPMASSSVKSLEPSFSNDTKKRKAKLMHGKGQWNSAVYYRGGGGYDQHHAPYVLDQYDPNYDSEEDVVLEEHVFGMEEEEEDDTGLYENHGDTGDGLRMVQSEPVARDYDNGDHDE